MNTEMLDKVIALSLKQLKEINTAAQQSLEVQKEINERSKKIEEHLVVIKIAADLLHTVLIIDIIIVALYILYWLAVLFQIK